MSYLGHLVDTERVFLTDFLALMLKQVFELHFEEKASIDSDFWTCQLFSLPIPNNINVPQNSIHGKFHST